jgi:hypothetical protein
MQIGCAGVAEGKDLGCGCCNEPREHGGAHRLRAVHIAPYVPAQLLYVTTGLLCWSHPCNRVLQAPQEPQPHTPCCNHGLPPPHAAPVDGASVLLQLDMASHRLLR